jgi:hypothetical protein
MHLFEWYAEDHRRPQSIYLVSGRGLEPGTSRIQSRSSSYLKAKVRFSEIKATTGRQPEGLSQKFLFLFR